MSALFFYCPLKPPNAAIPSGVPRIGALFVKALEVAGFNVKCPQLPVTHEPKGDSKAQDVLAKAAEHAAAALIEDLQRRHVRPRAWFTYHCYYKAPDLIGPRVAQKFGCPYVIAEGSYARKRIGGAWASHQRHAEVALASANVLLAATQRDADGLHNVPSKIGRVIEFLPFVDVAPFMAARRVPNRGAVRILTAGSMRDPRKHESYLRLFGALSRIPNLGFDLKIAGDGPSRATLEHEASALREGGNNIQFLGQISPAAMPAFFATGDVFAWPGVGEAYGLTYLEAQAAGLPVIAENHGGVAACVQNGISGVLVDSHVTNAYADALSLLIEKESLRQDLAWRAQNWVFKERSISAASIRLSAILRELGV